MGRVINYFKCECVVFDIAIFNFLFLFVNKNLLIISYFIYNFVSKINENTNRINHASTKFYLLMEDEGEGEKYIDIMSSLNSMLV
jgi:hypothetical protein